MAKKTYEEAAHAMQSGVAFEMSRNPKPTDPKHLRVGVNAAMVDHSGLVRLLIAKGVITEQEYLDAICEAMNDEVERYEKHLSQMFGSDVKLG